jgi:CP family cyanate transporter-like MFS transporter
MSVRSLSRKEILLAILLIWLAGNGLRLTILAVPPILTTIRDEFALSATQVGLLSSIPPALFGLAALVGSLLVARLGVRGALIGGLVVVAVGSALRGFSDNYGVLLATTVIMSIGIAIMQPVMPTAVRQWLPHHIALGTAIYTNGLLAGEVFPVLLTLPVVLPLVDDHWRWSLMFWSVPIAVIAGLIFALAPRHWATAHVVHRQWLPDWHRGLVWRLGALFCCVNTIYFASNAFIPIYLNSVGQSDMISPSLLALNLGQIPASLLLLAFAHRLERKIWPYLLTATILLVSFIGLVMGVGAMPAFWAGVIGFADAVALILALTLAPLLCKPEDVARTSAGTFTISYLGSVLLALICGVLWDVSGISALAFVPLCLCTVALATMSLVMRRQGELW